MGDLFKPVTQWISTNVGWTVLMGLFVLSLFFEFSKIKLSPITALFHWIGERLLAGVRADIADLKESTDKKLVEMKKETEEKLNELKDSVNDSMAELTAKTSMNDAEFQRKLEDIEAKQDLLDEKQDSQAASRIKAHVLNFSRQCRNGEQHTLEDFKNIISENEEYEKLVEKRKWKNNAYTEDYEYIMEVYRKCLRENKFLS